MNNKKIIIFMSCFLIGINSFLTAGKYNARVDDLSDLPTEQTAFEQQQQFIDQQQQWMPYYNLATIITAVAALLVAGYRYRKEIHDTVDLATKKCRSIVTHMQVRSKKIYKLCMMCVGCRN